MQHVEVKDKFNRLIQAKLGQWQAYQRGEDGNLYSKVISNRRSIAYNLHKHGHRQCVCRN
jgi:hypothetical protein